MIFAATSRKTKCLSFLSFISAANRFQKLKISKDTFIQEMSKKI